jgi:transcriptional regulator
MFVPHAFRCDDQAALAEFVRAHPFATLVSVSDGEPFASHLPLLLDGPAAPGGRLIGHLARANPHVRTWDGRTPALAVFHGPHAYVSSRWYVEQPAVPTWNYMVVHVSGRPRAVDEPARLRELLGRLLDRFEGERAPLGDEAAYREQLLPGIVGCEIEIERIEGKAKLGQNRSAEDRLAAAAELERSPHEAERATGLLMRKTLRGIAP